MPAGLPYFTAYSLGVLQGSNQAKGTVASLLASDRDAQPLVERRDRSSKNASRFFYASFNIVVMKKRILQLSALQVIISLAVLGNISGASLAPECNCQHDFDSMVKLVEENYAGFEDRITTNRRAKYEELTRRLQIDSQAIARKEECWRLLNQWIRYFDNLHLFLKDGEQTTWSQRFEQLGPPGPVEFHELDEETLLLIIPSFRSAAGKQLEALLQQHSDRLSQAPRLILDIRGNGGGADAGYRALLPLLYTGPPPRPSTPAILASTANTLLWKQFAENSSVAPPWLAGVWFPNWRRSRDSSFPCQCLRWLPIKPCFPTPNRWQS